MHPSLPALPAASQHNVSFLRRLLAQLAEPPRWARTRTTWVVSASLAAGLFLAATVYSMDLGCKCAYAYEGTARAHREVLDYARLLHIFSESDPAELAFGLLTIAALSIAALPLFFLTGVLYRGLFARLGRRGATAWTLTVHVSAHAILFLMLGLPLFPSVLAPILVGALWGGWLPRLAQPVLGPDHPNRPFEDDWRSVSAMHEARADDLAQAGTALTTSSNIPSNSAPDR